MNNVDRPGFANDYPATPPLVKKCFGASALTAFALTAVGIGCLIVSQQGIALSLLNPVGTVGSAFLLGALATGGVAGFGLPVSMCIDNLVQKRNARRAREEQSRKEQADIDEVRRITSENVERIEGKEQELWLQLTNKFQCFDFQKVKEIKPADIPRRARRGYIPVDNGLTEFTPIHVVLNNERWIRIEALAKGTVALQESETEGSLQTHFVYYHSLGIKYFRFKGDKVNNAKEIRLIKEIAEQLAAL